MPVDRGGLRYTIQVVDQFSESTLKFRTEIDAGREAFKRFREEVAALGDTGRTLKADLSGLGQAAKEVAAASRVAADLADRAARAGDVRSAAERKFARDLKASQVAIEARNVAEERSSDLYRRLSRDATLRQSAEEKLTKLIQQRARDAQFLAQAEEQGVSLAKRRASAIEIEAAAQNRLTALLERKAVAARFDALIAEQGVSLARKKATAAEIEAAAQNHLLKIEEQRAIQARIQQIAQERGIVLATKKAAAATVEEVATARLDKIEREKQIRDEIANQAKARGITLSADLASAFDAEAIAATRAAAAQQKLLVIEALRKRGLDAQGVPIQNLTSQEQIAKRITDTIARLSEELQFRKAAKGSVELQRIQRELKETEDRANRVSFTFRRLFGILAAFAAARAVVRGFQDMVREGIRFNAVIEQANLGIATLLTAVGEVKDATGSSVAPARQLALAQKEAARQTGLLRLEALQTAATFDNLVETFQTALAPGLEAGLNVEQVRKFTIAISQAAGAIGLAQNQLAEEIRSILSGTVQARTTRIAVALGITNEDIRNAKQAGVLAEFLQKKFEAFSVAGAESLKLFTVIISNVKDALLQLVSAGSTDFFNELKGLLQDILSTVVTINSEGIQVNPKAQKVVEALFKGLKDSVAEARRLGKEIEFGDALSLAKGIGAAFSLAAKTVGILVEGFVLGVSTLGSLAGGIKILFDDLQGKVGEIFPFADMRSLLVTAIQLATAFAGIRLAISGIGIVATALILPFKTVLGFVVTIFTTIKSLPKAIGAVKLAFGAVNIPLLVTVAAVVLLPILVKKLFEAIVGVNLKWETMGKIVSITLVNAFKAAASTMKAIFLIAINAVTFTLKTLAGSISNVFVKTLELASTAADKLGLKFEGLEEAISKAKGITDGLFKDAGKDVEEVNKAIDEMNIALAKAKQTAVLDIAQALRQNDTARDLGELLGDASKAISNELKNIFGKVDLGLDPQIEKAKTLSQAFEELPGIVGKTSDRFQETGRIVKELTQDLREAKGELEVAQAVTGLTGAAQKQRELFLNAEVQGREKLLEVASAQSDAEVRQRENGQQLADLQSKRVALTLEEQQAVSQGLEQGRKLFELEASLAEVKNTALIKEQELQKLKRDGETEKAQALSGELFAIGAHVAKTKEAIDAQKGLVNQILQALPAEKASQLQKLILDITLAQGQEKVVAEEIVDIQNKRLEVEGLIIGAAEERIAVMVTEELATMKKETEEARARLEAEKALATFRESRLAPQIGVGADLAKASGDVGIEQAKLDLMTAQAALNEKAISDQIAATKNVTTQKLLEQELLAVREQNSIELERQTMALTAAQQEVAELRAIADKPLEKGILAGMKEFAESTGSLFQQTIRVTTQALEGLAQMVSDTLTDIIFNEDDTKSVKERVLEFFKSLVKLIITELIKAIIVAAILSLLTDPTGTTTATATTGGAAVGAAASASVGMAKGGLMNRQGRASPWHAGAPGYKSGNIVRGRSAPRAPRGADRRDKYPIWARKDEFIVVPEAWKPLGLQFMNALNNGLIGPMHSQAMMEAAGIHGAVKQSQVTSFAAEGGLTHPLDVPTDPTRNTFRSESSSPRNGTNGMVRATVVANEQEFDRQLTAGSGAMLRFLSTHGFKPAGESGT